MPHLLRSDRHGYFPIFIMSLRLHLDLSAASSGCTIPTDCKLTPHHPPLLLASLPVLVASILDPPATNPFEDS